MKCERFSKSVPYDDTEQASSFRQVNELSYLSSLIIIIQSFTQRQQTHTCSQLTLVIWVYVMLFHLTVVICPLSVSGSEGIKPAPSVPAQLTVKEFYLTGGSPVRSVGYCRGLHSLNVYFNVYCDYKVLQES